MGMAVDNVIIYERIKEEDLGGGRTFAGHHDGFESLLAIIDGNPTTITGYRKVFIRYSVLFRASQRPLISVSSPRSSALSFITRASRSSGIVGAGHISFSRKWSENFTHTCMSISSPSAGGLGYIAAALIVVSRFVLARGLNPARVHRRPCLCGSLFDKAVSRPRRCV